MHKYLLNKRKSSRLAAI